MKSDRVVKMNRVRERRRYYKEKTNPQRSVRKDAYSLVHRRINSGDIKPSPCETCGRKAQAHHDSYLREDWLKVRWLCTRHHAEWHQKNEPKYPEDLSPWADGGGNRKYRDAVANCFN